MRLPNDLQYCIDEVLEDYLTEDTDMETDLSVYLINAKTRILKGKATNRDYLIPSVVVKSIVDLYNRQENQQVIYCLIGSVHKYY